MSGQDADGKRLIEVPICVDRLDIEFHNLCYYPSGKKGESLCVSRADYQECCYDNLLTKRIRVDMYYFFLRGMDPHISYKKTSSALQYLLYFPVLKLQNELAKSL
jgi:hypothetical protein